MHMYNSLSAQGYVHLQPPGHSSGYVSGHIPLISSRSSAMVMRCDLQPQIAR